MVCDDSAIHVVSIIITRRAYLSQFYPCFIFSSGKSTILQIVDANSKVIVDNLGAYFPQSGLIQLNNFVPRAIIDGSVNIKLTAIPQDQTVVKPLRNYVLNVSDTNLSVGVNIDYQNTNVVLG